MNGFKICFVFLELLVQLLSVASYTVVLKQVKPLYPSVKVYRYDLRHPKILQEGNTQYIYHKPILGQRLYPVVVKPGRDSGYKTRVPVKKFYKVSSTTEKPVLRDPRLLGLPQHLVPPVSNKIEENSETKEEEAREEENDIRPLLASPHAGKSFSSFGQEKGRIYNNPGDWATPVPQAVSENTTKAEFTPSQLYLQIRHKNTVIHVPQSEALKDAETLEELINAPRLKELARTTHVQETYSEEGYEDAGYDHAGHIRQAQHGEVYDAKDVGKFKIKEPPIILDYDSDLEESKKVPLKTSKEKQTDSPAENLSNKLEPRITRSRSEISKTSVEYSKIPKNYKGEHKYSSRVKNPVRISQNETGFNLTDMQQFLSAPPTFPSYFGEMPPTPETILLNDSSLSHIPPSKISSKYRKGDLNSTKIYAVSELPPSPVNEYTDFKPYMSLIDSQVSPSAKSLKYSRIYSKKTKQLRLEPYKSGNLYSPPPPPPPPPNPETTPFTELQPPRITEKTEEEESINQRIVLPTIGYINSLTTAHFGKGNTKIEQDEPKTELTDALNLTQALNYLRTNKNQKNLEAAKPPSEIDIRTFEPMRLKKSRTNIHSLVPKTKRDVYLMGERSKRADTNSEEYEGNDESDLPHNEKNEEIAEDEKKRIEEENKEKEKYESDLREEILKKEREIIKETFKNIGVEDDISEVFPGFSSDSEAEFSSLPDEAAASPVDVKKYPFYMSKRLPENSALRYATDPRQFPKKSGYKMEFYDSRERLIQCPDFHPDLEDLPDSNSTEYSDEHAGENQRIAGLGDKIACLRMKYFDPEPFDNPIFKEREIDYVGKNQKRRKKFGTKVNSKPVKINKDQKFQYSNHQKSVVAKPEKQKPDKEFNSGIITSHSVKPDYADQTVPHEIRHQPVTLFTKPIKVFSLAQSKNNTTERPRIIPVTEIVDELPPITAKILQNKSNPRPVIGWKTTYHSTNQPEIHPQASENKKQIVKPYNCLPSISKIAVLDGTKNLTIHCKDVILIQEIINNAARLRIIPKKAIKGEKAVQRQWNGKISSQESPDQTDWVPIAGYTLPKHINRSLNPLSRRTDEVTGLKNETTHNSSAVYVIDELKEDENVRKGEVVEDMDHYLRLLDGLKDDITEVTTIKTEVKTENSTRRKRETQKDKVKVQNFSKRQAPSFDSNTALKTTQISAKDETQKPLEGGPKPFDVKRPLTRLSGLDFLTRYHKSKGKTKSQNAGDFWKITSDDSTPNKNNQKTQKKNAETEKPLRITSKSKEKSDKTTAAQKTLEATTKKFETKQFSEFRKPRPNSSVERNIKLKSNQNIETRKISPLNIIPERLTKRPEVKASDFWKTFSQPPPTETTTAKTHNFTKIITKVSRETSESSEKPRIVYKKSNQNFTTETPTAGTSPLKPEVLQYKTIIRSSTPKSNDPEHLSRPTDGPGGPVLYYVVNLKTGRGKWITNYEDYGRGESGKYRKTHKLKEASDAKRDKRRKKPKN